MLALRPNCEWCDKDLPANSTEAMICSYECTFCRDCVDNILVNVCPNCGGGFCPRPIRPEQPHRPGACVNAHPAQSERVHSDFSESEVRKFSSSLSDIPPERR